MAALHRRAFSNRDAWSEQAFAELCATKHVGVHTQPHGLALSRTVAGETELLTLAVEPTHQRKGIAESLLKSWLNTCAPPTQRAFLEVAEDNFPAICLYNKMGFEQVGLRKSYYARPHSAPADALLLSLDLLQN
ncbi:MAG: N-acetyltransferase [Pseudomonadota bacterium]